MIDRRTLIAGLSAALVAPRRALAQTVTDAAGRAVPVPAKVDARVSGRTAGGDPALYAGARLCCSAGRAPTGRRNAPTCCRTSARGRRSAASPGAATPPIWKSVLALKPDLILDVGSTSATFVSLADARAGADRHSLCAARRPLRRHRRRPTAQLGELIGRPERRRGAGALRRGDDDDDQGAHRTDCREASGRASIMRAGRAGWRPGSAARSMSRPSSFSARAMSRRDARAGSPMSRSSRCCCGIPMSSSPSTAISPRPCEAIRPGRGHGGARRAGASVAENAVRLGRFPAVGQPADRAVVARQDSLSGAISGGPAAR